MRGKSVFFCGTGPIAYVGQALGHEVKNGVSCLKACSTSLLTIQSNKRDHKNAHACHLLYLLSRMRVPHLH